MLATTPKSWSRWGVRLPLLTVLLALSVGLLCLDLQHAQTGFLGLWSMDEYSFHISLLTMRQGLLTFDPVQFFAFGFWNYGFFFFFANLLGALPFLANPDAAATVVIPRLLTSACAIAGLAYIYQFARRFLAPMPALLLCLIGAILPAFWRNAIVFRPDWLLTAFVLASIYYLAKDEGLCGRYFWVATWLGAAAIGLAKVQAITYLSALLVYACQDAFAHFSWPAGRQAARRCLGITVAVVSLFVVSNPYLLHPQGARAWWRILQENMASNATNHGAGGIVTLGEKLHHAVSAYYFPIWVLLPLLALTIILAIRYFRPGTLPRVFPAIAVYVLVNMAYLLFAVNKAWQLYYLPVLYPLLLLAVCPLRGLSARAANVWLAMLLGALLAFHLPHYRLLWEESYDKHDETHAPFSMHAPRVQRASDALASMLANHVGSGSTVMLPWDIGFDYPRIGLTFPQMHRYTLLFATDLDEEAFRAHNAYLPAAITKSVRHFRPKDFVIIDKDAPFVKRTPAGSPDSNALRDACTLYARMRAGELGYTLLGETADVCVYRRRPDAPTPTQ